MAKLQGLFFGLATMVLVVLATTYFARDWLPPLNSDRGAIDQTLFITLVLTGLVFIITNVLLAYFCWRYADTPGAKAEYHHDNPKLEWTWTLVTAGIIALVMFNALGLWAQVTSPAPADALTVEITAQQFAWNVRYPGPDGVFGKTSPKLVDPLNFNFIGLDKSDPSAADDILPSQNEIYLPAGKPVRVRLRSLDVIHSFFLPNFRVKQDAMPGMVIETWFTPQKPGEFELACAEHCGLGHYRMKGKVYVVPASEFEQRLREAAE